MELMAFVIFVVFIVTLVLVASMWPDPPQFSVAELERRRQQNNRKAIMQLRRVAAYEELVSLRYVVVALLLVLVFMSSVGAFDFAGGVVVSLLVALMYGRLARVGWLHKFAQRLYGRLEPGLIGMTSQFPRVAQAMRTVVPPLETELRLGSRNELIQLIRQARPSIILPVERQQLLSGLEFVDKTVQDIMTPRDDIIAVDDEVTVGPLLLDELHRTGHSRFPVTRGNLDSIVGVLHTRDYITQKDIASSQVRYVMNPSVFYIDNQQTLERALAAFIKTQQQLFIVINDYRETVGLLTLDDCIQALFGRSIVLETDEVYDDQPPTALLEPASRLRELPAGDLRDK